MPVSAAELIGYGLGAIGAVVSVVGLRRYLVGRNGKPLPAPPKGDKLR